MALLAAYLDEAGTHGGSRLVNVAGAIASVPQWTNFTKKWKRQIALHNLSFFHMTDFVTGRGPYRGWDEHKKKQVLLALIQIIKDHVRYLVGNAVSPEDFDAAYAKHPTPCIKNAYHFCAVMTLPTVGYWKLASTKRPPVDLIFESGNKLFDQYFRLIQKDFSNDMARESYGIKSLSLGDKKEMPPLQAADIIAYGGYKCHTQTRLEPYLVDAYTLLWELRNTGRIWKQQWIEKALFATVEDLNARPHLYRDIFKDGW